MTIKQAVEYGFETLRDCGIDTPYLDAVVLFSEASGISKEKLYASLFEPIEGKVFSLYTAFLERRTAGYPVSYIRGRKEFFGREFFVDPRVLVPRPDTETLVEAALSICARKQRLSEEQTGRSAGPGPLEAKSVVKEANRPVPAPISVLDLCCGSGCIGVTVAAECRSLGIPVKVAGSDISAEAGEVFALNSRRILGRELPFIQSDLFENVHGPFDLVLSNPPYLNAKEIQKLKQRRWPEPELALYGGEDGLAVIRRIIKKGMENLTQNGYLLLEAAPDQMDNIESCMEKEGFRHIFKRKDLGNRERVIGGSAENS